MIKPYSSALVKLLQSRAVYDDETHWSTIAQYEGPIRQYFEIMGVGLDLNHDEGYARLTPIEFADDEPDPPNRLIRTKKLTYEQSLVAILLREWLEEHEGGDFKSSRLFVSKADLRNRIELFFEEQNNRKAQIEALDLLIKRMLDLGFLKVTQKDDGDPEKTRYEVKTLIKVKISNEKLEEFKKQLESKQAGDGAS